MAFDLLRTSPPSPLCSAGVARDRARLASALSDEAIEDLIAAAVATVERELSRGLLNQVWRQTITGFPAEGKAIKLQVAPVNAAVLEYLDDDGDWIEADSRLLADGEPARLLPPLWEVWPTPTDAEGNVRIAISCGYGVDLDAVPADLRRAVFMLISHYHENPQAVVAGSDARTFEIPLGVQSLLDLHRWTGFF